MQYTIKTLGCKVNQVDSIYLAEILEEMGLTRALEGEQADLCVVNTCTVTAKTDTQCRQMIRRTVRENPGARVVVTGCFAEIAPDTVRSISGVDLLLRNRDKQRAREILTNDLQKNEVPLQVRKKPLDVDRSIVQGAGGGRSRAFVRIQDGCESFCAYCIVPYARGPVRSEDEERVVEEVRTLVGKGFAEIVLTGIHLGAYGLDRSEVNGLTKLLRRLIEIRGDFRIRLSSIEPTEVGPELIDLVTGEEKVCNHLHIPLQSGDGEILKRMKRPYTAEEFSELVFALRDKDPEMGIGTDLIVGLPGETDDSFERSCEWIRGLPLTHFHVFPYSPRPRTEAASMGGQVSAVVKKERAARLRSIGRQIRQGFLDQMSGKILKAVAISDSQSTPLNVLTGNYLEGSLPEFLKPVSGIFSIKVSGINDDKLLIKQVY
jgi:threonylcarbamoyladenosine tRNA methylthiotransferase MtaB